MTDLFDLAVLGPFVDTTGTPTPPPKPGRQTTRELATPERNARFLRTLERLRWGDQPRCPHCRSERIRERRLLRRGETFLVCLACSRQFTARTGTILNGSTLDLPRWFTMIALALRPSGNPPIGAKRAARLLGTPYDTTKRMWRRIRRATGEEAALLAAIADSCQISVSAPQPPPPLAITATLAA